MKRYLLLTIMLVLSVVANAESISKEKAEQLALEVTQDNLNNLQDLFANASSQLLSLYDLTEAKEKSLKNIQSMIKTISDNMGPISEELGTIKETLLKDEFLTNGQKVAFINRRSQLLNYLTEISDVLLALIGQLSPDLKTVSQTYADIYEISSALKQVAPQISSITKKEELEKVQKLYDNSIALITADAAKIKAIDTDAMEATLKALPSLEDISKDTQTLSDDIDKAVAIAAGISSPTIDETEVEGHYDMQGRQVDNHRKGVQIIRLKNGQIRKIYVK